MVIEQCQLLAHKHFNYKVAIEFGKNKHNNIGTTVLLAQVTKLDHILSFVFGVQIYKDASSSFLSNLQKTVYCLLQHGKQRDSSLIVIKHADRSRAVTPFLDYVPRAKRTNDWNCKIMYIAWDILLEPLGLIIQEYMAWRASSLSQR